VEQPDAKASTLQPTLGRRLKALRISRKMSLAELSAETGLSSSFLSMVETGRHEMTVGRLVTLTDFYGVGFTDLMPEHDPGRPTVLRRVDRPAVDSSDRRVRTELLAASRHGGMTTRLQRFEVGAELAEAWPRTGPKFVFVLDGELRIEFSPGSEILLGEGDSVWFEGSRHHRQVNVGDREVVIVTFRGDSSDT
jgi:transcriptional regulator with XRE-family HTH domain